MQPLYPIPECVLDEVDTVMGGDRRPARPRGERGRAVPGLSHRQPRPTWYVHRRPADLPSLGRRIRLELAVRRFYCVDATCSRRTFAE